MCSDLYVVSTYVIYILSGAEAQQNQNFLKRTARVRRFECREKKQKTIAATLVRRGLALDQGAAFSPVLSTSDGYIC